jgi:hypothetical protein
MRTAFVAVSALVLAACSGPATTGAGPTTGATAPAKVDPNMPKWKLGHFSTPDGLVGAVVDRTGDEVKVKMDKSNDVVALFMEQQKNFRGPKGNYLNGPAGKPWFFLSEGGVLAYIKPSTLSNLAYNMQKRRGMLPFKRDADAPPLGPATKKGIAMPPPEKSPAEKYSDGVKANSVVVRFPELKPQDAGNLAKVEAAFKKAKSDMFFHVVEGYTEKFRWVPASGLIDNTDHGAGNVLIQGRGDDTWSPKAKGIKRYGISFITPCRFGSPCRIRQLGLKGWPQPIKASTVGLVWNVNGSFITLVTPDGGRYRVGQWWNEFKAKGGPLKAGVPAKASWPKPLQHETYDLAVIRLLAKGGAIDKAEADAVAALGDAYFTCKKGVWKKGRKAQEKVEASKEDANKKYGKLTGIAKRHEKLADKQCAKTVKKYERGVIKFIKARSKKRLALYKAVQGLVK